LARLPAPRGLVAFISDFGLDDPYVGIVRGVVERLYHGSVRVVDVSHGVRPFSVLDGAYTLYTSYRWFPRGTVFLVVVDPGVGSERRAVAVATRNYYFVGPDNGVLHPAAEEDGIVEVRLLNNPAFHLRPVSHSFHGRDIFAPAAAALAAGVPLEALGDPLEPGSLKRLTLRQPCPGEGEPVEALVVHVDRFGNLALGLEGACLEKLCRDGAVEVETPRGETFEARCLPVFSHAKPGELVLYMNSLGFPELAVNLGSAEERLGATLGGRVRLRPRGG